MVLRCSALRKKAHWKLIVLTIPVRMRVELVTFISATCVAYARLKLTSPASLHYSQRKVDWVSFYAAVLFLLMHGFVGRRHSDVNNNHILPSTKRLPSRPTFVDNTIQRSGVAAEFKLFKTATHRESREREKSGLATAHPSRLYSGRSPGRRKKS